MRASLFYFLPVCITAVMLFSCVTERRVSKNKERLKITDSLLGSQERSLAALESQRQKKLELNEIDDTASSRMERYIDAARDEIREARAENTLRFGETVVEKEDWDRLLKTLSFSRNSSKEIGDKILFLTDLINQNTVVKIDQDIYFDPGSYIVTPAMASAITALFQPAATAIDNFIRKYPKFPLSLVITAKGYADATTIAEGSSLYKELKDRLKLSGKEPDNKALNKELSNARAQEVIELFRKFAATLAANKTYLQNVLYLYEGKGENFPNPKVTDYKVGDSRRRVVYLFWSVFPE